MYIFKMWKLAKSQEKNLNYREFYGKNTARNN